MKKITKQFLFCALSLTALTFVGCDNDDATGDSTLQVTSGVVGTVSLSEPLSASQTVLEGMEGTYEFTVTLNEPQSVDVHVAVLQTAGSAVAGEDFDYTTELVIPAYTTTAVGTIEIINNCENGDDTNFTLQIGDNTTSNAFLSPVTVSFDITNFKETDLELAFQFNQAFAIAGTAYTLCGVGYDMDFIAFDQNGDLVPDFSAATGNCIETMVLTPALFPNGVYTFLYDIYDDAGLANTYHDPFDIPVRVDYFRCGSPSIQGTYVQEDDYVANSTDGSGSNFVVTVEVLDGVYTLKNSQDVEIASGKMANKVKAAFAQARQNRK